jgi:hypothetical protein
MSCAALRVTGEMDLEMSFSCRRTGWGRGLGRFSPGDWVK